MNTTLAPLLLLTIATLLFKWHYWYRLTTGAKSPQAPHIVKTSYYHYYRSHHSKFVIVAHLSFLPYKIGTSTCTNYRTAAIQTILLISSNDRSEITTSTTYSQNIILSLLSIASLQIRYRCSFIVPTIQDWHLYLY